MNNLYFDTDLLSKLPPWFREVIEYQQICAAEGEALEGLANAIFQVYQNMFFQTMDEGTVEQWETVFGIVASPSTEQLSFRRARILNRLSTKPPFSLNFLKNKLDELIGEGQWKVSMDYPNYTLYVESSAQNQNYASEVAITIGRIKPAHIVYINRPYTQDGLLLSEEISMSERVWKTRLGSWGLGMFPFAVYEDKGVIKVPTVASVQPELLSDVATFVSSDIASVRLNGSVLLTNLTKSVENNQLTVSYLVTTAQVSEVTSIELLDSSGNVLTSTQVYVPITSGTEFEHFIPVNEGVMNNG